MHRFRKLIYLWHASALSDLITYSYVMRELVYTPHINKHTTVNYTLPQKIKGEKQDYFLEKNTSKVEIKTTCFKCRKKHQIRRNTHL